MTVNLHFIQSAGKVITREKEGKNGYDHRDVLREICRTSSFTVLHPLLKHEGITVICETDCHLQKASLRSSLL